MDKEADGEVLKDGIYVYKRIIQELGVMMDLFSVLTVIDT